VKQDETGKKHCWKDNKMRVKRVINKISGYTNQGIINVSSI